MTFIRQALVDHLADAYRHRGSPYAELVIANRRRDMFPAECLAAVRAVIAETNAELVVLRERATMPVDPEAARILTLLALPPADLEELERAGFLDDPDGV